MAQTKDFLLPDLGEGLTEGEIVRWLVGVGDSVAVDQPVAEIETAKAVVEVPCPWAGTVAELHAAEGEEVQVGAPLITIEMGDAAAPPSDDDASGNVLVGYGTGGSKGSRRRRPQRPAGGTPSERAPTRPLAKPPVRKLAKDLGVDLSTITPSGEDGIVTREDVRSAAEGDGHAAPEPVEPAAAPEPSAAPRATTAPGDMEERIPVRGVRKAIAEKMTRSRREIPDATTWVDADATALWALRSELNASQDDVRVSALAIIMRAAVAGLRRFPEVNARLDTDTNEIVLQRYVHLGFAAQTDSGLVVPVIHDAHTKTVLELASELNRLAAAARDRSVKPGELSGGTFTISNYGSFGVDGGSAVINHPEAAILGVGRITERPWVHEGKVRPRKVMQLSIAFDHRICDGGEAAGFLRFLADCVEKPAVLLGSL